METNPIAALTNEPVSMRESDGTAVALGRTGPRPALSSAFSIGARFE